MLKIKVQKISNFFLHQNNSDFPRFSRLWTKIYLIKIFTLQTFYILSNIYVEYFGKTSFLEPRSQRAWSYKIGAVIVNV